MKHTQRFVGFALALGCLVVLAASRGTAEPPVLPGVGFIDEEFDCLEPTPHTGSVTSVTDEGQTVTVSALVLHDGISRAQAERVFGLAAETYLPIDVRLEAKQFREVTLEGEGNYSSYFEQMKRIVGGARPAGFDLVYLITSRSIGDGVAGVADCIGGVRFAHRAFAMGLAFDGSSGDRDSAHTAGHEIGHLLGAHHHYANCVEGIPSEPTEEPDTPCTVMFNSIAFGSRNFSVFNGIVVRGHAVLYASP